MYTAISIENLSKRYGKQQVLDNLTLDVPHGSIFGFLGPNGAGKSTTIKILAGLSHATSGSASVNDIPISFRRMDSTNSKINYTLCCGNNLALITNQPLEMGLESVFLQLLVHYVTS